MPIILEERVAESGFVERVWRSRSEDINSFVSVAVFQWDFVVWRHNGKTNVTIQGPATRASHAPVPDNAEFFGIIFKPGVYLTHLPASTFVNNEVPLPDTTHQSFRLNSETWELPTYDNADVFVERLVRKGLLVHEPVVGSVLRGDLPALSLRSTQRRFQYAAGLNYRTMHQIERARRAALRLREGASILDTVYEMGYFDQAHLTKALKHFIGQTPSQLIRHSEQLSLLYKTDSFC